MGERDSYPAGTFCWADLGTTEGPDAKTFYTALFGWDAEDLPAGDDGVYTMFRRDGRDVAALYEMGADERGQLPAHWSSYVSVEDLDAVAQRGTELGAAVVAEPFDVMDSGRMAVLRDPGGAHVHLWQPGRHVGAGRVNETGCMVWNELATPDVAAALAFYRELLGWEGEIDATGYATIRTGAGINGGRLARVLLDGVGGRRGRACARVRRRDHRGADGRHRRAHRGRARSAGRGARPLRGRRRSVMLRMQRSTR
jgi:predicted enzyme related to lactoylglutathione lyase